MIWIILNLNLIYKLYECKKNSYDWILSIFREDVKIGIFIMYCIIVNIILYNNIKVMFIEWFIVVFIYLCLWCVKWMD